MKKLLLILLCLPMIGFGQFQYKLDSITFSYIDPVTQNLTSLLWHTFYYDAQGRCNTSFLYAGGGFAEKHDNTYDINNNLIDTYQSNFDSITLTWDTVGHSIYTYDMSNNIVEKVWKYWNGNQWENNSKKLFYYNSNNERTHKENFDWDTFNNQWDLSSCDEYTYQAGKPIMEIEQSAWLTNSCADTSEMNEWLYLGNNLSYGARFGYATNTFNLIEETTFFCNPILLTNTAIPTYPKSYFFHSLGLFENQIDSATNQQGSGFVTYKYHYSAFASTSIQDYSINRELLKVTDLLGREVKEKTNKPLFYIFDDGTVEKRITVE